MPNNVTQNGSPTYASSGTACLDFFFGAGASRGRDLTQQFLAAKRENATVASQLLFWLRDIRGGAGERQHFRNLAKHVITPDNALRFMKMTIEVGRWDDLHVFIGTQYEDLAVSITADALLSDNALCAKWTPRKGCLFNLLRKKMELTPKELRHMLVRLSNTVEQLMSAGKWNAIEYSKLPSLASSRYMTAFHKQDAARYEAYKNALVKGETKINAAAIYPYTICTQVRRGNSTTQAVGEAQWKALPNYMEGNETRVLPIIDVSSSMDCPVHGGSATCMDVAVSLGLYVSERNNTFFKDHYITFHDRPTLEMVTGGLRDRLNKIYSSKWGGSTNLDRVFDLVLSAAVKYDLSEDDIPTSLIIFSDMEFNSAFGAGPNDTAFDRIRAKYTAAGYTMPTITFWRLNVKGDNSPVKHDERNVKLVSGFSPSLLKSVLSGTSVNPYDTMLETVNVPRYTL